eukprot:evm.model.scf_1860.4 EVM.evm.TU.scf_1860.4   scf_1860:29268-29681(+)
MFLTIVPHLLAVSPFSVTPTRAALCRVDPRWTIRLSTFTVYTGATGCSTPPLGPLPSCGPETFGMAEADLAWPLFGDPPGALRDVDGGELNVGGAAAGGGDDGLKSGSFKFSTMSNSELRTKGSAAAWTQSASDSKG